MDIWIRKRQLSTSAVSEPSHSVKGRNCLVAYRGWLEREHDRNFLSHLNQLCIFPEYMRNISFDQFWGGVLTDIREPSFAEAGVGVMALWDEEFSEETPNNQLEGQIYTADCECSRLVIRRAFRRSSGFEESKACFEQVSDLLIRRWFVDESSEAGTSSTRLAQGIHCNSTSPSIKHSTKAAEIKGPLLVQSFESQIKSLPDVRFQPFRTVNGPEDQ